MISHTCQNPSCTEEARKNKWGNYGSYCSDECMIESRKLKFANTYANKDMDAILEKRKSTNLEKYGVENVAKSVEVKEKLRVTTTATASIRTKKTRENNLEKYGVESTNSLQSVKEKKKQVFMERYGVDHQLKIPEVAASVAQKNKDNAVERLSKSHITNLERYGCENPSSNIEVQAKRTETMIERFGVENASQNAEVHEKKIKSMYTSKDYVLPSGIVIRVQGYEPRALDELLTEYNEDEIKYSTIDKPRILYNLNGKDRYYFPDFYIPKDNLIIEVKSQFTYDHNKTMTLAKRDACIMQGYNFKFIIYP